MLEFDYHFLNESDENSTYCTEAVQASGQGSNCCLLWAVHDIVQSLEQQVLPSLGSVEAAVGNYNKAENLEDVQTIVDNTQEIADVDEVWSTPRVPYTG